MGAWGRVQKFIAGDLADPAESSPRSILRFLDALVWEIREGGLSLRAMGLVYTTLLSLVPFLAATFSVLKAFDVHYRVEPFIAGLLEPLGEQGLEITQRVTGFVGNLRVGVLGALGLAGLFYTVISMLDKIEGSLNSIWGVPRSRSLTRKFSDYLSVVLVGPVLVFTALALTAGAQSHWLVQRIAEMDPLGVVVVVSGRVMPFIFLCVAFTFLYKFFPYTRVRLASALVGGATAAILWQLAGTAFAAFVAQSPRYAVIYSGFAVLVLFLIWLYVGWLVVLVGGLVAYLHQYPSAYRTRAFRIGDSHLLREAVAVSVLFEITQRHISGKPPCRTTELAATATVPPSIIERVVDEFVQRGILLRAAEPEGVALARAPETVTVVEILEALRGARLSGGDILGGYARPVEDVLRRRDRAVHQTLDGVTLQSLALEAAGSSDPLSGLPHETPTAR